MGKKFKPKYVKIPITEFEEFEELKFPEFKFKEKPQKKEINIIVSKKKNKRQKELF